MPKIKTHKGAAKRFSLSSNGKIMRSKGMKSHLRRKNLKEIRDYSAQKFFLMKQLEKE